MTDQPNPSITSKHDQGVAWIDINRPERRNALDSEARRLMRDAFREADTDSSVRVIVLRGLGGAFSAGVDLKETGEPDPVHPLIRDPEALVAPLERSSKPIIAAIDGPAVGGGFEVTLAADIRVATPRSHFALTEVRIGSLPGSGGTQRLFAAVPSGIAWRLLLTGDQLDAQRAYEVGLISDLIDEADFENRVAELALRVASAAPLSLRAAKLAGAAGLARSGEVGLAMERALWAFLSTTEDREEGRQAFREKRDPDYKGL